MSAGAGKRVLAVEARALQRLHDTLGESFEAAVARLVGCPGRVVVTGMGKSGLVGQKISATLASTGTASFYLHPADALHGDLGMVKGEDAVLALSNSGETEEILRLVPALKRLGVLLVAVTGSSRSTLAGVADLHIEVAVEEEGCPLELAPMASTTAQLALGDALAAELMVRRGFGKEDFALFHPAGALGKRLMRVRELMHTGASLPRVTPQTPMREAILEISAKKLGMAVVAEAEGAVRGVLTDGDLRRLLERHGGSLLEMTAGECTRPGPRSVPPDVLAAEALRLMEEAKITSLVVQDGEGKLLGVLHLHDLWRLQLL